MKEDFQESRQLFDGLNTDLQNVYEMALAQTDLLCEAFSPSRYREIRDLQQRYGDRTLINQGAMKKIFKVEDKTSGRYVAMAFAKQSESQLDNERFLREARLTATLEHPNIMPVYDIGINFDDQCFFTMKLTGGANLCELIKKRLEDKIYWSLIQRLTLFMGICEGVAYAHSHDVLHLDLKPQNVQVGEFGEVLICDWGLGKVIFDESHAASSQKSIDADFYTELTLDGEIKGTPGYMAPEQIERSAGSCDYCTDIYALGGILHTLLSFSVPVSGETVQDVFDNTLSGKVKQFTPNDKVPLALEAVCFKALALKPAERYQNIEELKGDLEAFLGGYATKAQDAGFITNVYLLMKRHRAFSFFFMALITISLLFVRSLNESEKESRYLLSLYEQEKQQSKIIGREAAPYLITQANRALLAHNYEDAITMADKAVLRDSGNESTWKVKGKIHFYRQEFHAAQNAFSHVTSPDILQSRLAAKYAVFQRDTGRVETRRFIELLHDIKDMHRQRLLFRYEVLNYENLINHMQVVREMMFINNRNLKKLNFTFKVEHGKNILDLSENPNLHQIGCIRMTPLHKLVVSGVPLGNGETAQFRGMPLEELDISGTKINRLDFVKAIPNLKKLIISKGQFPVSLLKKVRKEMTFQLIEI